MKTIALSCVWGDEYISRFLQGTAKSLAFPENREAMRQVTWNIFTNESKFQDIDQVLQKLLPDTDIRYKDLSLIRDRVDYLHSALLWQIKECLNQRAKLLLLPPDSIFGDQTVKNLIEAGKEPGVCVFLAHPRALPSILNEDYLSNQSLVKASWKHLHRSWTDSEEGHDRQSTYIGGVAWKRLNSHMIEVKHLLPTPYYMDFNQTDLDFFEKSPGIGDIDHVWPSHLYNQKRIKYIPNSDVGFVVEITESDKNLPQVQRGKDVNQFWQYHPHNIFFEQVKAIFRSE